MDDVEFHVGELHNKFHDVIESLLHTYEARKLEEVIVDRSKKAVSVQDKSTFIPNVDACCTPNVVLDYLSGKTQTLSQVELDLAMEAAEEGAARAFSARTIFCATRKQVELDLAMEAAAVHAEEAATHAEKHDIDGNLLESEDVGHSGSEACNKCHKIDEGKKPDVDAPCWDLITPLEDKRLSVGTNIYCIAKDVEK
ncbi:hypothetical protein HAX54_020983 [Datura stramonium]|uniref:Uncharacterized protein n=1 Tax=Datura stramonium TaxID=4076 RepID=A0ABS8UUT3_DATST|nr:hypothetical protein [Datura stramonium]